MTAVNYIYRNTKFDGRVEHRNIRFEVSANGLHTDQTTVSNVLFIFVTLPNSQQTRIQVQRIKIDDDSACSESYNGDLNPFCMENIDVSNFLNLHSLGNHEFFCLAYVFTYRSVLLVKFHFHFN